LRPLLLLKTMKKEILIVLSVVLVVVIVACGLWLGYYAVDSQHQKQTYETLAEDFLLEEPQSSLSLAEEDSPELSSTTQESVVTLTTAPPCHDLAALQSENPDCVGWLTIPDTSVDYPVVWTPSDPEHYLRRDFYGNHASGGTPFLDGRNQARAEGQNLILYGHNMLDGSMFKPVLQYFTPNFQVTHEDIYLELNGAQYHYQVIADLETNTRSPVYTYTDLNNTAEMEDFRAALLEETGVGAIPQAEGYLTLSTCNNQGGNSRVLVIAALVEEVQR
jgi:sortase B